MATMRIAVMAIVDVDTDFFEGDRGYHVMPQYQQKCTPDAVFAGYVRDILHNDDQIQVFEMSVVDPEGVHTVIPPRNPNGSCTLV